MTVHVHVVGFVSLDFLRRVLSSPRYHLPVNYSFFLFRASGLVGLVLKGCTETFVG